MRDKSTRLATALAFCLVAGPLVAQPVIELDIHAISDASGTPNTSAPGLKLPFFQPGETVRVTLSTTNSGTSADMRSALSIAPIDDHASPVFDSHALGLDNTTGNPLDNAETSYYSFDWTIPLSVPWGNYDIGATIRSTDFVAEYDSTGWRSGFTIGEFGTTVMVHGFQLGGTIPSWPLDIAQDIKDRIIRGRIWTYTNGPGTFSISSDYAGDAENILVFDWASESNDNFEGYSEAAGEALFTALMEGGKMLPTKWSLDHLHLIGHSRGSVVVSEAAQRLLAAGEDVDHVTYLDPVWAGAFGQATDFDVNANHPSLGTRGVAAWDSAGFVDNFFSHDDVHDDIFGIDGDSIPGARNLDLGGRGSGVGHSDIWRWYDGTIDLDATSIGGGNIEAAWYGGGGLPREQDGFGQSRLGGYVKSPMIGTRDSVAFDSNDWIVNGDFERGPQGSASSTRPDPGWDNHGGGGSGLIDSNRLTLEPGAESRTRNRIWDPGGAFRFVYSTTAVSSGTPDTLAVSYSRADSAFMPFWTTPLDTLGSEIANTFIPHPYPEVSRLRFAVVNALAPVESIVSIDDLGSGPRPFQQAIIPFRGTVVLEGAYNAGGSMNSVSGHILPAHQPFDRAPWHYSGDDSLDTVPDDAVDWVLLEFRTETSSVSTVERNAVILHADGTLRETSGQDWISVNAPFDSHYVVIHHRNHVSVASSGTVVVGLIPVPLGPRISNSQSNDWDFTQPGSAFGPGNNIVDLGDGYFGMAACDINQDGQVTAGDFNAWLVATKSGATGYLNEDCNLDGQVTAADFNLWLVNTKKGVSSGVPD